MIYVVIAKRPGKDKPDTEITEVYTYDDYGRAHDMLTRLLNQHRFTSGFVETCELIKE